VTSHHRSIGSSGVAPVWISFVATLAIVGVATGGSDGPVLERSSVEVPERHSHAVLERSSVEVPEKHGHVHHEKHSHAEVPDLKSGKIIADVTSRLEHLLRTTVDGKTGRPLVEPPAPEGFEWAPNEWNETNGNETNSGEEMAHRISAMKSHRRPQTNRMRLRDHLQFGTTTHLQFESDEEEGETNSDVETAKTTEHFRAQSKSSIFDFRSPSSRTSANPAGGVAAYYKSVSQYPRLKREEEVLLGQAIEIGNKARKALRTVVQPEPLPPRGFVWADFDKCGEEQLRRMADKGDLAFKLLVLTNLNLVTWVVRNYFSSKGLPGDGMMDLIQDGNCGLIKAIERWDWRKEVRFTTYATNWIRQHVSRGLQTTTTIRVPEHVRHKVEKLRRERAAFVQTYKRDPTHEELALKMKMKLDTYVQLVNVEKGTLSTDCSRGGGCSLDCDDRRTILDMIDASNQFTPNEHLAHRSLLKELEQLVLELPSTEQFVLNQRFGLHGAEPHTLNQVGELMGMEACTATRVRIGRLQQKAIKNLLTSHRSLLEDLRSMVEEDIEPHSDSFNS
jgi:RNA polymerase sigma factor (sigma-70 family)